MIGSAHDLKRLVRSATGGVRPCPTNWNYVQQLLRKMDPEIGREFDQGVLAAHHADHIESKRCAERIRVIIARKYGTAEWRDLLRTVVYAPTPGAQRRHLQ